MPPDVLYDLKQAFDLYAKDTNENYILMSHFKNILHNFGFHKMPKKDIDDELKKADPDFVKRTAVDF